MFNRNTPRPTGGTTWRKPRSRSISMWRCDGNVKACKTARGGPKLCRRQWQEKYPITPRPSCAQKDDIPSAAVLSEVLEAADKDRRPGWDIHSQCVRGDEGEE